MLDLLLPRTDGGVFAQAAVAAAVYGAALLAFRRRRDVRLFVVGLALLTFALMGVRAIH